MTDKIPKQSIDDSRTKPVTFMALFLSTARLPSRGWTIRLPDTVVALDTRAHLAGERESMRSLRRIAEAPQTDQGWRCLLDHLVLGGQLGQYLLKLLNVRTIGHANFQADSEMGQGSALIDNLRDGHQTKHRSERTTCISMMP
jgi:hypothetical protein